MSESQYISNAAQPPELAHQPPLMLPQTPLSPLAFSPGLLEYSPAYTLMPGFSIPPFSPLNSPLVPQHSSSSSSQQVHLLSAQDQPWEVEATSATCVDHLQPNCVQLLLHQCKHLRLQLQGAGELTNCYLHRHLFRPPPTPVSSRRCL